MFSLRVVVLCKKENINISCMLQVHQVRRIDTTCEVPCYDCWVESYVLVHTTSYNLPEDSFSFYGARLGTKV